MFISKYNISGSFAPNYIKENFCHKTETILFTRFENKHIAIIIENSIISNGLPMPIITLEIEQKIPLWKQSMNMQMGKPYQTKQNERVTKQVRWLNEKELHGNMRFEVYRFMYM